MPDSLVRKRRLAEQCQAGPTATGKYSTGPEVVQIRIGYFDNLSDHIIEGIIRDLAHSLIVEDSSIMIRNDTARRGRGKLAFVYVRKSERMDFMDRFRGREIAGSKLIATIPDKPLVSREDWINAQKISPSSSSSSSSSSSRYSPPSTFLGPRDSSPTTIPSSPLTHRHSSSSSRSQQFNHSRFYPLHISGLPLLPLDIQLKTELTNLLSPYTTQIGEYFFRSRRYLSQKFVFVCVLSNCQDDLIQVLQGKLILSHVLRFGFQVRQPEALGRDWDEIEAILRSRERDDADAQRSQTKKRKLSPSDEACTLVFSFLEHEIYSDQPLITSYYFRIA